MNAFNFSSKSSTDIAICFFSLLCVIFAPKNYSYGFCLLMHNLFLLTFAYDVYKNRKEGVLSFNLLFSVSLYFTSFFYPVFIYNTSERYFSMFDYRFDETLISYGTAVVYMAYCFLQLGLNNKQKQIRIIQKMNVSQISLKKSLKILSVLFTILLFYFILNDGLSYFSDQFIYSSTSDDKVMGYFIQLITPISYTLLFLAFNLQSKNGFCFYYAVCIVGFYAVAILSTGSRTIPLSLILLLFFLYNDKIKRIGIIKLGILGIFFIALMSLVGALRGNGDLISVANISENTTDVLKDKSENYFSFANELIICNRNLYYLISSTQTVGYTFGMTLLGSFLGMVPFLRSIFMSITGIPEYYLNSPLYNTVLSTGIFYTKGLGTHAVADVYICWGILGVILVFYLYGFFISKIKERKDNYYYSVAYYVILSNAIYACRASIFNLNQIIWTIAIVYLVLKISKKKSY